MSERGKLFVVATPIGNLEDFSARGKITLEQADLILCEDTRRTRNLLSHFGIRNRVESFHQHNQAEKIPEILAGLDQGNKIALATDAGTPTVSDPGAKLIRAALEAGIKIVPIPGPSAITTALSASGFNSDRFLFLGFLPAKSSERKKILEKYQSFSETIVIFEAPHRIRKTIGDLLEILGDREACLCRELTKVFEEIKPASLSRLANDLQNQNPKGEITLILAGADLSKNIYRNELDRDLEDLIEAMLKEGKTSKEIISAISGSSNLTRNQIYRLVLEIKSGPGNQ